MGRWPSAVRHSGSNARARGAGIGPILGSWVSAEIGGLPPISQALSASPFSRVMSTSPHAFVTVDMQGLKAPLVACAAQRRLSVSAVVRNAVAVELGEKGAEEGAPAIPLTGATSDDGWVKLSIRMRREEVARLTTGARAAKLSRGAYLAGLIAGVPVLLAGGGRPEHIAALTRSCAELSTLSRSLQQLMRLLRAGDVQQALVYRELLDRLDGDVRRYLGLAAQALADLRPAHGPARSALTQKVQRRKPWQQE